MRAGDGENLLSLRMRTKRSSLDASMSNGKTRGEERRGGMNSTRRTYVLESGRWQTDDDGKPWGELVELLCRHKDVDSWIQAFSSMFLKRIPTFWGLTSNGNLCQCRIFGKYRRAVAEEWPGPQCGKRCGWRLNFVRMHIHPCWLYTPPRAFLLFSGPLWPLTFFNVCTPTRVYQPASISAVSTGICLGASNAKGHRHGILHAGRQHSTSLGCPTRR